MAESTKVLRFKDRTLDCSRTRVMGILNVTPDSFSDGGKYMDTCAAVQHASQMVHQGADIIDIGAESTRPGSQPVSADQQIRRAIPVIEQLAGSVDVPISIDSHNYEVVAAALQAGASIVNDITALADTRIAELIARHKAAVVLMHMQGTPATMQKEPRYDNVVAEVLDFLLERAHLACRFGILSESIIIDPGIGFGKTQRHNLTLLKHISRFVESGFAVLVGASRKRFTGAITDRPNPQDRVFAAAAISALMANAGVAVVRVHDVTANLDAVKMASAIARAE